MPRAIVMQPLDGDLSASRSTSVGMAWYGMYVLRTYGSSKGPICLARETIVIGYVSWTALMIGNQLGGGSKQNKKGANVDSSMANQTRAGD